MVERVTATPAALELIEELKRKFGPKLFFFQSGGCCDNSAANCYLPGDLTVGSQDIYLGTIGNAPFFISKSQFEFWQHTQVIVDVVDCQGGGTFSLEGGSGKAFLSRSRLFTDTEWAELEKTPPLTGDVQHWSSDQE